MNSETHQRITKVTAAFMIIIALVFDLAQVAAKLFTLMGTSDYGGVLGQLACYYANIDAPGTCGVVGKAVGTVVRYIPVAGPALEKATMIVGTTLSELLSGAFMLMGYATMYLWFLGRGVPIFSGKNMQQRATFALLALVIDITPFFNVLPGITIWTIRMVMTARAEDKEKVQEQEVYDKGKNFSRMRQPTRNYVQTNTY